jgi:hypothetical protein
MLCSALLGSAGRRGRALVSRVRTCRYSSWQSRVYGRRGHFVVRRVRASSGLLRHEEAIERFPLFSMCRTKFLEPVRGRVGSALLGSALSGSAFLPQTPAFGLLRVEGAAVSSPESVGASPQRCYDALAIE